MILPALILVILASQANNDLPKSLDMETSPRELYVSCSLALSANSLLQDKEGERFKPQAPATCLMISTIALNILNNNHAKPQMKFCPRGAADFEAAPGKAMELAYIEYYEKNAAKMQNVIGLTATILAFTAKWPCA